MRNRYPDEAVQLGELECEVHAVEGFETKKLWAGYCGGIAVLALAGCVPLAKELKDPAVRYLLSSLLLAGAAAFFGYAIYWQSRIGKWVAVYQQGIVVWHRGRAEIRRWDEIAEVYDAQIQFIINGMASHTNRFVKLLDSDGQRIEFGGRPKTIALAADAIADHVYAHIGPGIMAQLAHGQAVDFGPIRVSATGIETAFGALSWDQLQKATLAEGRLRLYDRDGAGIWFSTKLSEVPNSRILFEVVQNALGRVSERLAVTGQDTYCGPDV